MSVMAEERPIFENEEWRVTEHGLEHKDTGYFIEREGIANRRGDGLWTWPMHMAEKNWCRMEPFAEAFSCAASAYRLEAGSDLAQTLSIAQSEIASFSRQERWIVPSVSHRLPTLQKGAGAPILGKLRILKKPASSKGFSHRQAERRDALLMGQSSFPMVERRLLSRLRMVKAATFSWRTPRRIRRTGTKLVRLIQIAWNIR